MVLVFFFVGLFLRFTQLEHLPQELHRDEAAIALNALSVLRTSYDEHNQGPYPIIFQSFGDYKLPGMIYLVSASLYLHGFSHLAIRLPGTLIATLLIPVSYCFVFQLFYDKKKAVLVAFFIAISMWHVTLSRTIYEPIAALTITTAGLACFLAARKQIFFGVIASALFLIASVIYNVPLLLMPVVSLAFFILFRKQYLEHSKKILIPMFLLGATAFLVPLWVTIDAIKGKSGVTIFTDQKLHLAQKDVFDQFIFHFVPYKFSLLLSNQPIQLCIEFLRGYAVSFSTDYLFFRGGDNPWHSLRMFQLGNLELYYIFLLPLGLIFLIKHWSRLSKGYVAFMIYLLLSPLPNAFTLDSPNTNRLMDMHLGLVILAVVGIEYLGQLLQRQKKALYYFGLFVNIVVVFGWFLFWSSRYYILHSNFLDPHWNSGIREVSEYIKANRDDIDEIYLDLEPLPDHFLTYPQFVLYTDQNINEFQETAQWNREFAFLSPRTFNSFHYIHTFPLDKLSLEYMKEYFPGSVDKVLFVRKLDHTRTLSPFSTHIVKDTQGRPSWEITILEKKQLK